jgi:hypothetical protein
MGLPREHNLCQADETDGSNYSIRRPMLFSVEKRSGRCPAVR